LPAALAGGVASSLARGADGHAGLRLSQFDTGVAMGGSATVGFVVLAAATIGRW
jgi:hypothetical protein